MFHKKIPFDGLALNYDLFRPRYPKIFFNEINHWNKINLNIYPQNILDIGSGTGIALEGLITKLGNQKKYFAIDISKDMINIGKKKFPFVSWIKGTAENKIHILPKMDIITFAQSFQWMKRIKLLKLIKQKINHNGIICIMQNNRNYKKNIFLNEYEDILETINPHYSRKYRNFNYEYELKSVFYEKKYIYMYIYTLWEQLFTEEEFIGMSSSSTQVQNTININKNLFKKKVKELINNHLKNNKIKINFISELFLIKDISINKI